ncbi:uncharacterized protein Tco025E_09738 [Trypanosoma conorhini]|uniref:C3H1-type domain-containing protein n=1 Tax=Trypanosoma conorhini TaxID=83891 RepID=A0A422MT73_9TRYP|nr:uncharacterized protein Tco025E_09738 [Trypanosoma conorhini]RNE96393.1 hypothetical protein Tco025E_09738 [Trypanosoma conorhini]
MIPQQQSFDSTSDPVVGVSRHLAKRSDGTLCMVVVDPATRKLLIPCNCIYPTRAQQRATIPSLCQLFLQGRCRQGPQCHQVHASVDAVVALRSQVGSLPWCCTLHGDRDHANAMNERSWLSKVVLYIPEVSFEGGYVPLRRLSYTPSLRRILKERPDRLMPEVDEKDIGDKAGARGEGSRLVLDASDQPICRLHIFDRCRYADDCRFLHLCKEITNSYFTSQDAGNAKPASRGQQNTSVFTSVSRQQKLRGYPLQYSANESVPSNAPSQVWSFTCQNTWDVSAASSWPMYPAPELAEVTAARGGARAAMMVQQVPPPSPTPVTPNGSFCAPTVEGSVQGLSFPENAYMNGSYTLEPTLLVAKTPPCANAHRASSSIKVSLSLLESDGEMDADRPAWDEDSPSSSPDGVSGLPAVTGGTASKRHWQHNPYRAASLFT